MRRIDLYISILAYGRDNVGKSVKYSDLLKHLTSLGYKYDEFSVRQFFADLFIDKQRPDLNDPSHKLPDTGEYYLKHQGYFNLLEYTELTAARRSSTLATCFATLAILISIGSMFFSIHFSKKQLEQSTKTNTTRIEQMQFTIIEEKLESLNKGQDSLFQFLGGGHEHQAK